VKFLALQITEQAETAGGYAKQLRRGDAPPELAFIAQR
jgi:hypothetical protein